MKSCCQDEAKRNLKRHRDVAICDRCGRLLIAYGNDLDFDRTVEELTLHQAAFETASLGRLRIVAKTR